MTALALDGVSRAFDMPAGLFRERRRLHAVSEVTLEVAQGEILGLVGESGCGKTTLARMMLGLLPPSAGTIRLFGTPLEAHGPRGIAAHVQPVFQDPYSSLNPRKTVAEIVALPLRAQGIEPTERRARVRAMLDRVSLSPRLINAYPNQLSGGQRQRVAIARALVARPKLVICDEPTSALDVSVQAQILNLLQDLQRELDLTYVLISHNLAVVRRMATRVAVMYLGRLVEVAPTAEIFAGARHPYTRALLASALTLDPGAGIPALPLGDTFPDPLNPPAGCAFHPRCPEAFAPCGARRPRTLGDGAARLECHRHDPEAAAA